MKLTTITHITVDGVIQGLGGPDEDRSDEFDRGGWQAAFWDPESGAALNEIIQRPDAFLFGRRTYDIFAPYWPTVSDADSPIAASFNAKPKYVASTTLTHADWAETTVLDGDLAAAVADLKAKPGGELQVNGSCALVRWLLANELVDEMMLMVYPVILGQGKRLFPDTGLDTTLELLESRSFPKGVTLQVYKPAGRPRYGWSGDIGKEDTGS